MVRKAAFNPSMQDLEAARQAFELNEPRDLFYRVATALVDLAVRRATTLSTAEALAVLLQTWNSSYYRFHGKFDAQHFQGLEQVLSQHEMALAALRTRAIESLTSEDELTIASIFGDFEHLLGPVGAAKGLHLLAPDFFPLWDRAIASAYGAALRERGANAQQYLQFMLITQAQCNICGGREVIGRNPLKALDEYNYCKYSRRWI